MSSIDILKNRYLLQASDILPTEQLPEIYSDCRVTPLIDSKSYFGELKKEINARVGVSADPEANKGQFVFIAGWWLDLLGSRLEPDLPVSLDGEGGPRFIDLLKEKAQRGVDVRILGFANWSIMAMNKVRRFLNTISIETKFLDNILGFVRHYEDTINTIEDLRSGGVKCCFNTLGHAAGGAHMKLVVIGNRSNLLSDPVAEYQAVGFTGGVDFRYDRYDDSSHPSPHYYGCTQGWHDVTAKVEGPVVQDLYDCVRNMWNELVQVRSVKKCKIQDLSTLESEPVKYITSRSVVPGTDPIEERKISKGSELGSKHWVQSLLTVPLHKYEGFYGFLARVTGAAPLSYAPNGVFSAQQAWQKAISNAESYIYMEDWAFWSQDVMVWINDRIQHNSNLRVILVKGLLDPNDPPMPELMIEALNKLLLGLSPEQNGRVRMFLRKDVQVHSKTTLIDDKWTIIGSTVCARRSLYTDLEHSIALIDEESTLVKNYRRELWRDHFKRSCPSDLDTALKVWFGNGSFSLPSNFEEIKLILPFKWTVEDTDGNKVQISPDDPDPQRRAFLADYRKHLAQKAEIYYDPNSKVPWGRFSRKEI